MQGAKGQGLKGGELGAGGPGHLPVLETGRLPLLAWHAVVFCCKKPATCCKAGASAASFSRKKPYRGCGGSVVFYH